MGGPEAGFEREAMRIEEKGKMRMLYGPSEVLRERGSHERRKNGPG